MWTLPLVAAGLFLLGSCVKEASESVTIDETVSPEVTAVIAANETRTVVDADLNVLWEKGDQISVFVKSQKNRCYQLVGEGGEASGTFKYVSGAFYAKEAPYYYGVYPYDPETTLYSDGTLSVTVPDVQPYKEDSFAEGVNVMAAASEDHSLSFKNICGYVQLKLYGAGVTVKSIVLKGNNGEEIAGSGEVFIEPDVDPELTLYTYGSATEITVEAETPITLGETEEDATVFWFVVAPTVFEDGFTVQVIGEDGEVVFEKATEQEVEIERNVVYGLKAVEVVTEEPEDEIAGHKFVEMGPNGLTWATCNVGADKPEDYGDYFAWGETKPKEDYSWATYKFNPSGDGKTFTKYTTVGDTLEVADDAACANWGGKWRMPTDVEWEWLFSNCTWIWTTLNGVKGMHVKAENGNSIFLPAAGYRYKTSLNDEGEWGFYWYSSLGEKTYFGRAVHLYSTNYYGSNSSRYVGHSIRPVCD